MKDFTTFTTEYREQALKNSTNDDKARQTHEFYGEVTAAGKPRYLNIENSGIKMPQELHQAIVAGKLKEAWQHFAVHPMLTRQEEGDDEML